MDASERCSVLTNECRMQVARGGVKCAIHMVNIEQCLLQGRYIVFVYTVEQVKLHENII